MTEQELNVIKQVLETAGSVGSQGFEAMVRYTYVSGIAWLIGGCALLVCCLGAIALCFMKGDKWGDGDVAATVFLGSCIVSVISVFMVVSSIVDVVEPEGTTVKMIVEKAASK